MRLVVIAVAAAVTVVTLVKTRRAASLIKKNTKATNRRHSVEHAVSQKPGLVEVPKPPKIKRG